MTSVHPEFRDDTWQRCAAMVAAHLAGDRYGQGVLTAEIVEDAADDDEAADFIREHIECLVAQQAQLFQLFGGTTEDYRRMIASFVADPDT